MAAWAAHFWITFAAGSNSRASDSGLRPARTSSTILRLNSAGYVFFAFDIGTPPFPH